MQQSASSLTRVAQFDMGEISGRQSLAMFAGRLYNRGELLRLVDAPQPISDAELIAELYAARGEQLLSEIRGIFAVLIWDARQRILLAARDPLGIYPLFYAEIGNRLLFSTSTEQLVRHQEVPATLNRAALADHLCHRWPLREETFFAKVKRLPPGHVMRIQGGWRRIYRYWDPAPPGEPVSWVSGDVLEQFGGLLNQAVERCLQFGPAGVFLSAGLDSASVAAAAAESSRDRESPPWALSLGFSDPECDERILQQRVAAGLGVPQVLMPLEQAVGPRGVLSEALEMSSQSSAPLLNLMWPAFARLAAEGKDRGCRVILTGTGGDEWLTVTPFYAAELLHRLDSAGFYRLWKTYRRSYRHSALRTARNLLWKFGARPLISGAIGQALDRFAPGLLRMHRRRYLASLTPAWVAPDIALRRELEERALAAIPPPESEGFYLREVRSALDHNLVAWEVEECFEQGQRMGLPILHPFLDPDLVDLLYRTPPETVNQGGWTKGLVRQTLARKLPRVGFERQKKVTAVNWFRSTMLREGAQAWRQMGGTPALAEIGVVDPAILTRAIEQILAGGRRRSAYHIWDVLNLESWIQPRL